MLPERQLESGRSPGGGLGQPLIDLVRHLDRTIRQLLVATARHQIGRGRECNVETFARTGRHVEAIVSLPALLAVDQHTRRKYVVGGGDEQILIADRHTVRIRLDVHVRIQLLDFLRLGGGSAVREDDAVAGEFVIVRTIVPVATIRQAFGAVRQTLEKRLVDVIPDEAALILLVTFQFGVQMHAADGVTHGMHVFARDIWFLRIGFEIFRNFRRLGIHAAFHVGNVIELTVPEHALVMHRTQRIVGVREIAHRLEHRTCIRFVAQRPDHHGRMIVVAAHHRLDAVHACFLPFGFAARHVGVRRDRVARCGP